MVEWIFKKSGLPVDYELKKIIEAIEKTPEEHFRILSKDLEFLKLPNSEKYEYFKKNPQSIFYYRNPQLGTHSVFTNFKVGVRDFSKLLYYDNIRLWHYGTHRSYNDNGKELMRVREIDKHSGLELHDRKDWGSWHIIDFLNPELVSESFINWDKEPWSDLK